MLVVGRKLHRHSRQLASVPDLTISNALLQFFINALPVLFHKSLTCTGTILPEDCTNLKPVRGTIFRSKATLQKKRLTFLVTTVTLNKHRY